MRDIFVPLSQSNNHAHQCMLWLKCRADPSLSGTNAAYKNIVNATANIRPWANNVIYWSHREAQPNCVKIPATRLCRPRQRHSCRLDSMTSVAQHSPPMLSRISCAVLKPSSKVWTSQCLLVLQLNYNRNVGNSCSARSKFGNCVECLNLRVNELLLSEPPWLPDCQ